MKYVIGYPPDGYPVPLVFPECVSHAMMAAVLRSELKINVKTEVTAGFVYKHKDGWKISDQKSESLKGIGPDPNDQRILEYFLRDGLTGLELANQLAYDAIQARKRGAK